VLGVFGLSQATEKSDIEDIFSKYGNIEHVDLILDRQTGRSKGFGFVYYETIDEATKAKNNCNGMVIDGRKIRTDYSATLKPHQPTPGQYMGRSNDDDRDGDDRGGRGGDRGGRRGRSRSRDLMTVTERLQALLHSTLASVPRSKKQY